MAGSRDVRCPDCRHPIALRRWLRLPDPLVCYRWGAALVRSGRTGIRDGPLIWLVLMLPATLLPLIGGIAGHRERGELPAARALEAGVGARAANGDRDRGESPHPRTPEPP